MRIQSTSLTIFQPRLAAPTRHVRLIEKAVASENDMARARLMADAQRYLSSDIYKGRHIDMRV